MSELAQAAGLAYRHTGDLAARPVLLVHGYPESSFMWERSLAALAAAGWYTVAPDLAGYGDSEPDPPGTWERHTESLARFVEEMGDARARAPGRDRGPGGGHPARWPARSATPFDALDARGQFSDAEVQCRRDAAHRRPRRVGVAALDARICGDGERGAMGEILLGIAALPAHPSQGGGERRIHLRGC
jgi:hypothetical protein